MILKAEEGAVVSVTQEPGLWVCVHASDGSGSTVVSLTAKEARQLGDALLTASQVCEDRIPHGNS